MSVFMPCGCKTCFQKVRGGKLVVSRIQQHSKKCLNTFVSRVKAYTGSIMSWRRQVRNDPCSYCGGKGGTADHIIPQSEDGGNTWENLTGACFECNMRKSSKSLLEFLVEMRSCVQTAQPTGETLSN